jgi:hypothetical protein
LRKSAGRFLGALSAFLLLQGDVTIRRAGAGTRAGRQSATLARSALSLPAFDFLPRIAGRGQSVAIQIAVRIRNQAEIEPQILAQAQRETTEVLDRSGIGLAWLDCSPGGQSLSRSPACHRAPAPTELVITVLQRSRSTPDGALGRAICPTNGHMAAYATVYVDLARRMATGKRETATILGYAMAHELGHLLLGANSHSAVGIMRSHWKAQEILTGLTCRFHFTDTQSAQLREAVRARTRIARSA